MAKANSWAMSQKGLDSRMIRDEELRTGVRVLDIDDFDSPHARDAYVNRQHTQRKLEQARRDRKAGRVVYQAQPNPATSRVDLSGLSQLGRIVQPRKEA